MLMASTWAGDGAEEKAHAGVISAPLEGLGTAQGAENGVGGFGLAADEQNHHGQAQQQNAPVGAEQGGGQLAGGLLLKDGIYRPAQQGQHGSHA